MKIVLFIWISVLTFSLHANKFQYDIKQADKLHTSTVSIDNFDRPELVTYNGLYDQTWILNDSLNTQQWTFKNVSQNTKLIVKKINDELVYSGQYRGKELNYTYNISEFTWLQYIDVYFPVELFNKGLRKFTYIRSRDLKPITLSIKEIKHEDLNYRSFKLYISPFPTFLWSIDYIVDAKTGLVFKKRVSGSPTLFMNLK